MIMVLQVDTDQMIGHSLVNLLILGPDHSTPQKVKTYQLARLLVN